MKQAGVILGIALLFGITAAEAKPSSDFECFADQPGDEICLVLPDDAVISLKPTVKPQKMVSPATPTVSMLSRRELSGEALSFENDDAFETAFNPAEKENLNEQSLNQPALLTSIRTQESVRWIETFLKAGPSGGSDNIFVQPASKAKD